MKKVLLGVFLGFVLFIGGCVGVVGLIGLGMTGDLDESGSNKENSLVEAEEKTMEEVEDENKKVQGTDEKTEEQAVPKEFQSALSSAKTYSNMMHMSKQGVYDQLTSEFDQFSHEAAQYAVDNVEANWKENALETAKTYRDMMSMSNNAIYDQLISFAEQFTEEEAQYAIDNLD